MNDTLVFAKTPLGLASYADPSAPLTQAERTLLIVIDGAKPVSDLRRFNAVVGDSDLLVDRLQQAGYIVAKPTPAMRVAVARDDDALPALRARAANFIAHQLGSYGDRLCRQLESAQSHDVLHNHIEVAAKVLEELKGRAVAEAFRREINP
jgi:hypothetical protein